MARKVKNITNSASSYDILSQTPGNYSRNNYFLKELQEKVDEDWNYRPNRATIEFESERATMGKPPYASTWEEIEVVEQTVKSDEGNQVSRDYLNIVFRDIHESRFTIGHKFRTGVNNDINVPDDRKMVWIAYNTADTGMTKSVAIRRCNGVLGSRFVDSQGVTHFHYEPVIQNNGLTGTGMLYNQIANAPRAQLVIMAQDNEFTREYRLNQRFIIGAPIIDQLTGKLSGQLYRINAIDRVDSNVTYDPSMVGLIRIYLEITESSVYDDFEHRIAYQENSPLYIGTGDQGYTPVPSGRKTYSLCFEKPVEMASRLGRDVVTYVPVIRDSDGKSVEDGNRHIVTTYSLENCPAGKERLYIEFAEYPATGTEAYHFTLRRRKIYLNGDLVVTCRLPAANSPTGEDIVGSFTLVVREQEA